MDNFTTEIDFLSVTVTKVGYKLETNLYCKPNDTQQYFHAKLCHRNVFKRSIAYEQVVRFKTIYLIEEKLNNRLEQLKQMLVKRGFKEDHVDSETERVKL